MIELEKIVPSAELCNQIPDGKFTETALIYFAWENDSGLRHNCVPRSMKEQFAGTMPMLLAVLRKDLPAPTADEIMTELAKDPRLHNIALDIDQNTGKFVAWAMKAGNGVGSDTLEIENENAATAMLLLFFSANNIEVQK